jgi:hypothetical protein
MSSLKLLNTIVGYTYDHFEAFWNKAGGGSYFKIGGKRSGMKLKNVRNCCCNVCEEQ